MLEITTEPIQLGAGTPTRHSLRYSLKRFLLAIRPCSRELL